MGAEAFRKQYTGGLLRGDAEAAAEAVEAAISEGIGLSDIYLKILSPALKHVGDSWAAGKLNVGEEHLATQITLAEMEKLRRIHRARGRVTHRALVACVEGEEHFVGARMIADLFVLEGWAVDFLGPNVPTETMIQMVRQRRPHLLALSATMESGISNASRIIDQVKKLPVSPKILLGGSAVRQQQLARGKTPDWAAATDVAAGLKLGRNLLHSVHPKAVLEEYLKEFGRRVRELRGRAGWTQQQLADVTKLARAYIISVESGKQNVSLDVLLRIANALRVPPEDLLMREQVT
jgi:methanogenic corrinoid protein MtbC1/DNA-binding XRE family transcriptional regulator